MKRLPYVDRKLLVYLAGAFVLGGVLWLLPVWKFIEANKCLRMHGHYDFETTTCRFTTLNKHAR